MTIRSGGDWGARAAIPSDVVVVRRDSDIGPRIERGDVVLLAGGDMLRTLGGGRGHDATSGEGVRVTVDLLWVRPGQRPFMAASHVLVRRPWWRGGPLMGAVTVMMNAQFMGTRDVAPRGHPNDGRFEVVQIDADMGVRQRLAAWRRARTGSHLPHPSITVRPTRSLEMPDDGSRSVVLIDGVRVARRDRTSSVLMVDLLPDAAEIWFV